MQNAHVCGKKSFSLQHSEISHFSAHTFALCHFSAHTLILRNKLVMLATDEHTDQCLCLPKTNEKIDFNSSNAVIGQIQRGCSLEV